jgi:glycosyltransferase involved in cell wall biosynthesis
MNVLFIVRDLEAPSSRYRVRQYVPYLGKAGIESIVVDSPRGPKAWHDLTPAIKKADLVFVQRKRLPLYALFLLKRAGKPMIYDFDDAVMYRNTLSGDPHSLTRRLGFRMMTSRADLVIAGNAFLEGEAKKHHRDVRVLPTPIDESRYPESLSAEKEGIAIGWIGSASTIHYLESLRDVWEELGTRYGRLSLTIISDVFIEMKRIPVNRLRWSAEREVEFLQGLDIGIMPLFDDLWSRGKCGFKLIQYLGAGIPAVCSPVGINREIVENGVSGLWANSKEEWVEKLSMLIEDRSMRRRLGAAGRQRVLDRYTVQVCAPTLIKWFKEKGGV